jgi:hypothetical protein
MERSWSYPIPMAMQPTARRLKARPEELTEGDKGRSDKPAGAQPEAAIAADRARQVRAQEAPAARPKPAT